MENELDEMDVRVIRAMAEYSLNGLKVARALHVHRNTVVYHAEKIYRKTGLDPRRYCDLLQLLQQFGLLKIAVELRKENDHE